MLEKEGKFEGEKIRKKWHSLISKFKEKPLDFNFKEAVLACLQNQSSNIYTHSIHSYPAKMFVYIPRFFLSISDICSPEGKILDPFCGSGTVLLESLIHPLYKRNVYGVEINPLGRLISKVKTTPLPEGELREKIDYLLKSVQGLNSISEVYIPDSANLKFWFSEKAINRLGKLRYLIEGVEEDDYRDFFWLCFSSIIRKVSNADPFIPPPVRLKIEKYNDSKSKERLLREFIKQIRDPDVAGLFRKKVEELAEKNQAVTENK